MAHHKCLLGCHGDGGQEPWGRDEELQLEGQQVPDEDVIPVLRYLPHNKHQCVELADVGILHIHNAELSNMIRNHRRAYFVKLVL